MQSRYTLISGATGSGKTSFTDYCYILSPWSYLKEKKTDIYWEVNYFSLERKRMFKHAKWVSWMIYRDNTETLLAAEDILGGKHGPLNKKGYNLVRSYDEEMSQMLEHVQIYDGKVSAKVLSRIIRRRALELGTLFKSDDVGVLMDDDLVYVERFEAKGLVENTKMGPKPYIDLEFEGHKFRIYEEDHHYITKNKKAFVFFIIDGINLLGSKEEIDKISVELADARDIYGFSPVLVTQQNRAMGDITRMKMHGADLSPQLEDIFKSSQMGFDADLVIGLFDPYKYKSWDKDGKYGGYCINPVNNGPSMQTPSGLNRFRSAHILKNTFGQDGNKFGMKFLGECNHFEVLPFAESLEMDSIYSDVLRGV